MKFYGYEIDTRQLPQHIGIIMDGNGRWAQKRNLQRSEGHKKGFDSLTRIIQANKKIGVKYITVYAFSTENWNRPAYEVNFLMSMAQKMLASNIGILLENDVRFSVTGTFDRIPPELRSEIENGLERTAHCKSYVFNVAFNYGGRREIVDAAKTIAESYREGKIDLKKLDEKEFSRYLYHPDIPDADMIIRTSGEMRVSNFLLWESVYAEFWFTKKLWPDFTPRDFSKAIYDFQQRKRRFGKV